jgi:hypothetical protein
MTPGGGPARCLNSRHPAREGRLGRTSMHTSNRYRSTSVILYGAAGVSAGLRHGPFLLTERLHPNVRENGTTCPESDVE